MRTALWTILGLAAAVAVARFVVGPGAAETPRWMLIVIGLGVVAAAGLLVQLAVDASRSGKSGSPGTGPRAFPVRSAAAARARNSLAFVLSFAVGFALMPYSRVEGETVAVQPAVGEDPMFIDGNRNAVGARFYHEREMERHDCDTCHHMPAGEQLACGQCHRSMHEASNIFQHDWHASPEGAGLSCGKCHAEGQERRKASAKACRDCHPDLFPESDGEPNLMAPSYYDAMHGLCLGCHEETAANEAAVTEETDGPGLADCQTCHEDLP